MFFGSNPKAEKLTQTLNDDNDDIPHVFSSPFNFKLAFATSYTPFPYSLPESSQKQSTSSDSSFS
jgi:hypothetical protein